MPILKSAIKKLRRDKKKEKENDSFRLSMEKAVKKAKKVKSQKAASDAFSIVDKAVKKNLIHKNKAKRIKSAISKVLPQKQSATKSTVKPKASRPAAKTATRKK